MQQVNSQDEIHKLDRVDLKEHSLWRWEFNFVYTITTYTNAHTKRK